MIIIFTRNRMARVGNLLSLSHSLSIDMILLKYHQKIVRMCQHKNRANLSKFFCILVKSVYKE